MSDELGYPQTFVTNISAIGTMNDSLNGTDLTKANRDVPRELFGPDAFR